MPPIKQSQELLHRYFDPLIRANAEHVVCEDGALLLSPEFLGIARSLTNGKNRNAWLGFEIQVIAMGAGWYEGLGWNRRGTPRPPLCHYE